MIESRTLCLVLGAAVVVLGGVAVARAQERIGGDLVTLVQARNAQTTWGLAAIPLPGPMTPAPAAHAAGGATVALASLTRDDRASRVVAGSQGCAVMFISRHKSRHTKIECW